MKLHLLFLLPLLCLSVRAESGGSVVFFDAPNQRFIRGNSIEIKGQDKELSTHEVAAAISVLLGSTPGMLSADSSSKLNEVIFPNPFDRPRAVFMLEVTGIKDPVLAFALPSNKVGNAFGSSLVTSSQADVELSDEDEVFHLDEPLSIECDAACIGQELAYLEGRYVGSGGMDGELIFSLVGGSSLSLHFAKKSDRSFALSLVSLTRSIKKALENHEVIAEGIITPAELLIGRFTGIEALEEEYGSGDKVRQGIELLQTALTKSFELLQKSYNGKIVGVILSNTGSSVHSSPMINVKLSARVPRWLAEVNPLNTTISIEEVILVRRTLALITGIILLVSTLLGICCLMKMPLTRDTLLYSNVKLD